MLPRCILLVLVHLVTNCLSLPASYDQRQTGNVNVQVELKDVQVLAVLNTELLDDYTEYDYFYDYADFTLKPIVKPTSTPSTTESTTPVSSSATQEANVPGTSFDSAQNSTLSESSNANSTSDDAKVPAVEDSSLETNQPQNDNSTSTVALSVENPTLVTQTSGNSTLDDTMVPLSLEKPEDSINGTLKTRVNDKTGNTFESDEDSTVENAGVFVDHLVKRLAKRRCRSGYSPDGKGRCRRLGQQRLSLIPLAMRLAPKLLNDMTRSAKNLEQEEAHWMHLN